MLRSIEAPFHGFFERRRQKRADRVRQEELYRQADKITLSELQARLAAIETFPGSKAEYEELRGMPYDYVDVPGQNKFLHGTLENSASKAKGGFRVSKFSMLARAVELGADAIVNFTPDQRNPFDYQSALIIGGPTYSGVPVKKHQEPQSPQEQEK